jgi:acyl carrier protein
MSEILEDVSAIIKKVTKDNNANITFQTSAKDVKNWDSLNNVFIIVEMEKKFKMKFKASEVQRAKNVGELIEIISARRQ